MEVIRGVRNLEKPISCALTIGNFDGVHLGHKKLVTKVLEFSKKYQVPSAVVTFDPHPVQVLYPERRLKRLFPFDDQIEELEKLGLDYLVIEPFSRDFSALNPSDFLSQWIIKPLNPKAFVVGYDFTFGANKSGDIDFLKKQSETLGFELFVVEAHKSTDLIVSSSQIRKVLSRGDVDLANTMLGRPFYLKGTVVKGEGRGKNIGIPTANMGGYWQTIPANGVYRVSADVKGKTFNGVCNVGVKPTFHDDDEAEAVVEVHLFNFNDNVYGYKMRVEFLERIRDEKKFSSAEDLIEQIHKDIDYAKKKAAVQ